jgi:acetylornithine deacetylase
MTLTPVEQLLIDLLLIPSESDREERLAASLLEELATSFKVEKIRVDDERFDILATAGEPKILLAAHMDTVVGQLPISTDEENIYGRGSCDTKGSLAAMIIAAKQVLEAGATDLGLLFTVGEETVFDGAKAAAAHLKKQSWKPRLIVIGEPTGLEVVTAQKGILSLEIDCSGTKAHSSHELRDSATQKLVTILAALDKLNLPGTLYNIGVLSGGEADNIVADRASARLSWRSALPDIRQKVEAAVTATGVECRIDIKVDLPPVTRDWKRFPKREVNYYTEMVFFDNSVVCGPGDILDAHSADESVTRQQLNEAVETYSKFIRNAVK